MYIKVTEALPPTNEEVWIFNGEHEIKNVWDGTTWKYELKYPVTHWTHKPTLPTKEDVLAVREQLNER